MRRGQIKNASHGETHFLVFILHPSRMFFCSNSGIPGVGREMASGGGLSPPVPDNQHLLMSVRCLWREKRLFLCRPAERMQDALPI